MSRASDGHEPSPVTGLPSTAATLAGPSGPGCRYRGRDGPNAGHAPQCRMRGRPWILPPDALVIQSGGPLGASAGHGPERCQGPRKRHGAGTAATGVARLRPPVSRPGQHERERGPGAGTAVIPAGRGRPVRDLRGRTRQLAAHGAGRRTPARWKPAARAGGARSRHGYAPDPGPPSPGTAAPATTAGFPSTPDMSSRCSRSRPPWSTSESSRKPTGSSAPPTARCCPTSQPG
jgi:hypothetical protein